VRLGDLLRISLANLWRTKLRTVLTTLGVTIGIGALVSMMSFGTGMQKNITRTFYDNDLFTSLRVTPFKIDLNQAMSGNVRTSMDALQKQRVPLTDSLLQKIQSYPEVAIAFPEVSFPVKVRLLGNEARTNVHALPAAMGKFKPYDQITWGRFFSSDTAREIVMSEWALRELKYSIDEPQSDGAAADTARGKKLVLPDTLIGKQLEIVTSVLDLGQLAASQMAGLSGNPPFKEQVTRFTIGGIRKRSNSFENPSMSGGLVMPIGAASQVPRFEFSSMWSLLDRTGGQAGYGAFYVRVKNINELKIVRRRIEAMGLGVISIADQLDEIKRGFLILDTALGAVGAIALVVAALGIINTMVMSILERRREIGIMKAVGGSESQIKGIFFFEAGFIGLVGGIFGLILGWLVTRLANFVINIYLQRQGEVAGVDLFYIPFWLIAGALGFAILVSLLSGLYPAIRAARVNPVEALRHD